MPGSRRRSLPAGAAVVLAGLVVGTSTIPAGADETEYRIAFTFTDRDITESSGLVDHGALMFTVNDSGDDPVLYAVDKASGDTVAETTYASDGVEDVEAVAPGPGGAVWVGDIGDNNEERPAVSVYRVVPLGGLEQQADAVERGEQVEESVQAEKFDLVYPDSPHNAEALLVHPDTGRLYVVTKAITGGTVYAAPERLDPGSVNRLEEVGHVPGLVTDGAFLPGGTHVMLRWYGRAVVHTFPGLREVGNMDLPSQEQGEGLAIGRSGKIHISSEGAYSDVLQIQLPREVSEALGDAAPEATLPSTSATPPSSAAQRPDPDAASTEEATEVWVAAGLLALTAAGWLWFTVARRRSRRTW